MTDSKKNDDDNGSRENLFQIMDGIIAQLNRTKKMFIIMILTLMIIPPISFVLTFELLGPPSHFGGGWWHERSNPGFNPAFEMTRVLPILISLIWLGIGIRQWFVLSKWTKKYERYKELQKKVDEKLDEDNDEGKEGQQK